MVRAAAPWPVIGDTDVSPTVQNDRGSPSLGQRDVPGHRPDLGSAQPLRRMGEILNAGKAYMASLAPATQQLTPARFTASTFSRICSAIRASRFRTAEPVAFDTTKLVTKFLTAPTRSRSATQ